MEGYLTATASEDWGLVLEVCERASSSESNAKEAVKALRREFKSVPPTGHISMVDSSILFTDMRSPQPNCPPLV